MFRGRDPVGSRPPLGLDRVLARRGDFAGALNSRADAPLSVRYDGAPVPLSILTRGPHLTLGGLVGVFLAMFGIPIRLAHFGVGLGEPGVGGSGQPTGPAQRIAAPDQRRTAFPHFGCRQ